ncbi:MAG: hypothetical protein AVDCRST_MAG66-2894 [uncultured Pseudonocardia sp.]|uniref:HTH hxlR-type domain-containing protein n=1 Tax=uncultured Pseudonocardia sp. TaxID=211455 RepID=A0A6J4PWA3_9PSEU|nr:MAG: hypothetical protein AVDCRST_MAG66-2894 [uncultured Pseudonocardia sp.]
MSHLRLLQPVPERERLAPVADPGALAILWSLAPGPLRTLALGRAAALGSSATARRLRALLAAGLVRRRVLSTVPPHVRWELSAAGADVVRATGPLRAWARGGGDALQ